MPRLKADVCHVDLRRYLDRHKQYSAFFTSRPIWLDIHLGSVHLFDDNEIAAAYRVLQERGYIVTSTRKDGGWLLTWREDSLAPSPAEEGVTTDE